LNDDPSEIEDLCTWIIDELGPDVPVHFTRFHPNYLLKDLPPTPVESLDLAYDIARSAGVNFPYVGNVYGHKGENSYCPGCGEIVIGRKGYLIEKSSLKDGACGKCGRAIPGVWS
ncbi:MAG: radical SAM protein, partial [candidate division Zixibacteria bacterium]